MKEREQGRASPEQKPDKRRARVRPLDDHLRKASDNAVVNLQQTMGNQAVARFLAAGALQEKLRVSEPEDADEQEAERIAETVVSAPETLHRKCGCAEGASCPECRGEESPEREVDAHQATASSSEAGSVPENLIDSLGPGMPLDPATRQSMESRFGQDFAPVRVHANEVGASTATGLNARAFTAGQHIVFGTGEYSPRSHSGARLLAHELAHTVQGRKSSAAPSPASSPVVIKRQSIVGKASALFSEETGKAGKWVDEKKWAVYRAMIAGLKSAKTASISQLRGLLPKLPTSFQGAASSIIDVVDFFVDMEIALLLAIIGLAAGFVEGIVGLIVGLVKLALGLLKMTVDWLVSLMGKPDEYQEDIKALVAAVKGIPRGLTKIKDEWLERYKHANAEEQVLMGGELVGQIEAFIATFAFAGTKAGQAGSLTFRGGEAATQVVGRGGAAVLERAPAVSVTIPAVVPKTAAEAAVVSTQMMMMSTPGPGAGGAAPAAGGASGAPLKGASDEELDKAIENMKAAGDPQQLQPHAAATPNRQALGVSGKDVQSAHGAPQSVMKNVPGYSPNQALTRLLDRAVHSGMDQYWKETFQAMRSAGRTQATAQEIHDIVAESIRRAPGLSAGDKSSLIARLSDEMFVEFGLKPGDLLDLPYPNISPP